MKMILKIMQVKNGIIFFQKKDLIRLSMNNCLLMNNSLIIILIIAKLFIYPPHTKNYLKEISLSLMIIEKETKMKKI